MNRTKPIPTVQNYLTDKLQLNTLLALPLAETFFFERRNETSSFLDSSAELLFTDDDDVESRGDCPSDNESIWEFNESELFSVSTCSSDGDVVPSDISSLSSSRDELEVAS